jgi:ATP-binding cassette subfamily C (CFTR/MRP) protein 1
MTAAGSNLDPFDQYGDARLWNALRRSYLVGPGSEKAPSGASTPKTRFTFDTVVDLAGRALAAVDRARVQQGLASSSSTRCVSGTSTKVSLAADVRQATASVDLETDSKIQDTIQVGRDQVAVRCESAHEPRTRSSSSIRRCSESHVRPAVCLATRRNY